MGLGPIGPQFERVREKDFNINAVVEGVVNPHMEVEGMNVCDVV